MTTENPTNLPASVRARLKNKADEIGLDFNQVLQYYAMERFLYRLSKTKWADCLIVKGAAMLRVWDGAVARPTRDIDFLGRIENSPEAVAAMVRECLALSPLRRRRADRQHRRDLRAARYRHAIFSTGRAFRRLCEASGEDDAVVGLREATRSVGNRSARQSRRRPRCHQRVHHAACHCSGGRTAVHSEMGAGQRLVMTIIVNGRHFGLDLQEHKPILAEQADAGLGHVHVVLQTRPTRNLSQSHVHAQTRPIRPV